MHIKSNRTQQTVKSTQPTVHRITKTNRSDFIVVKVEGNIARAKAVGPDELGIARRTLVLGVTSQHALNAETNTLDILHR